MVSKIIEQLIKLAAEHPDEIVSILQALLNLFKLNPNLLKEILQFFADKQKQ